MDDQLLRVQYINPRRGVISVGNGNKLFVGQSQHTKTVCNSTVKLYRRIRRCSEPAHPQATNVGKNFIFHHAYTQ